MTHALPRFEPLPDSRLAFLETRRQHVVAAVPAYDDVRRALLALGGLEVVRRCHVNVARLRRGEPGTVVAGWALANDGLWREHSWVLDHGDVLTDEESARFVASEPGPGQ